MSQLFGNTTEIPGRMSPGEFMLKSEAIGVQYGHLFNQAYQGAANRKRQADQGAPPPPRPDGYDPNGNDEESNPLAQRPTGQGSFWNRIFR